MQATIAPPEQRVLMHNISWETYERLLAESVENPGMRFTYDSGELEIMVVSLGHEQPNRTLALIVEIVSEEMGRNCRDTGMTTFKRDDLLKGFEPDSSFYFANARLIRGLEEIDLHIHPPPELVIEIDITRSSLKRFPIFAAVGVLEVWRYDGERVSFHALDGSIYRPIETSRLVSPMTAKQATLFFQSSRSADSIDWKRSVREWVRKQV